jgi:hypothetical protein
VRFMTIDIKDFYLNTPMARPEFKRHARQHHRTLRITVHSN